MVSVEYQTIPVTILTGFLGSGKTTLLNHILESQDHKMRFAIIENEFGEVGVDDKVIKEASEDQVIEVMNGCICCTVRGDLVQVLKRLQNRINDFDGVIIETTGLADPAPVAQTFFIDEEIQRSYRLDGIITVVDSKHVLEHIHEEKPEGVENECQEQVAFADRILLNKCDLVDEATLGKVEKELRTLNKSAQIIRSEYSKVHPSKLININAFELDKVLEMDPEFMDTEGEHQHDLTVSSVSVQFEGEMNQTQLQNWLGELLQTKATDLFRYKGVLAIKGVDYKFVFQGVHMIFNGEFDMKHEWKPDEKRECRFVFIGRNLDKQVLEEGVLACKVAPLRFKEGDTVEVKVDSKLWVQATITALWSAGWQGVVPYRVKTDVDYEADTQDGKWPFQKGTEVDAPIDTDEYIRKPLPRSAL